MSSESAKAIRKVADAWQFGGWANVLLPASKPPAHPIVDYAQRVTDWLRERADIEEQQPDNGTT